MGEQAKVMEVVVAQLVERTVPTLENCGLNPIIGKILSTNYTIEKTKIKKKEAGKGPSLKIAILFLPC